MTVRILAVDDSALILKLLTSMLSPLGYEVHCAQSGPEALAQVGDIQPNLVILDVTMPEMDGYEVCRSLRQNPWTALSWPKNVIRSRICRSARITQEGFRSLAMGIRTDVYIRPAQPDSRKSQALRPLELGARLMGHPAV